MILMPGRERIKTSPGSPKTQQFLSTPYLSMRCCASATVRACWWKKGVHTFDELVEDTTINTSPTNREGCIVIATDLKGLEEVALVRTLCLRHDTPSWGCTLTA